MPIPAMLFLGAVLLVFAALDVTMLASLLRPGDERNQIIVGKASAFTLCSAAGSGVLTVIDRFVRAQPMAVNPFVHLEVIAVVYFFSLMYYRKKYGG